MQNYVGKQIDRYRIIERLGMGGMAVVYKAYDTRLERDVALKLIRTGEIPESQHKRLFKRFEREAKAQASFSHRNIIPVFDYGEVDGSPYLVMAYISGGTLKDRLSGPVDWRQAVQWLIPVAEALSYAHQRGIAHRDVKPANILFDEEDQPILTDFGIAKVLETDEATLTGTGLGVGTPEYMAPEQWQGQTSPATDQYALGVVLYEIITGRKPYSADTPAAIILMQATEPLQAPSGLVEGIPDIVEKVLYKALAHNPQDRYETMDAFAEALRGLLAEPISTGSKPGQKSPKLNSSTPSINSISSERIPPQADLDITIDDLPNDIGKKPASKSKLIKWVSIIGILCIILIITIIWIFTGSDKRDVVAVGTPYGENTPTLGETTDAFTEMAENQSTIESTTFGKIPEIADNEILFYEDFEDGFAEKVKGVYGDWEIITDETENAVYDINNTTYSDFQGIDIGELSWSDYKILLNFRFLAANDKWIIVEFRRSGNADEKYVVSVDNDGVSLHYTTKGVGWQSITWKDIDVSPNIWYQLQIETKGESITVAIDGDVLIHTTDSRFASGSVNIQASPGTHAQFDNIIITSLD